MSENMNPLEPPTLTDAISDLIALVELSPEAQDPGTDLWAAVFTARESLAAAMKVPELLRFNVNDSVKVKLTKLGLRWHKRDHDEFWDDHRDPPSYEPPKVDKDGYSTFQMWQFLEKFGKAFYMTAENVIEGNNLYFERAAMRTEHTGGNDAKTS